MESDQKSLLKQLKFFMSSKRHTDLTIDFQHKLMGGCAIDATGNPLPDDSLACAKAADAVLLGAVGGPKWGTGKVRPEQGTNCLVKWVDVKDY